MAYALPTGGSTIPMAPAVNLFPPKNDQPIINLNCPGGVCITRYHDKVFRYTTKDGFFRWHFLLTWAPLILLVILLLALIAWIPVRYNRRYKVYEDALEQRLVDAMGDEETQIYA